MTKALLKKQLMEVFSWLYQNKKSGKHRSKWGTLGYGLLYLLIFGALGVIFYEMAKVLCAPLTGTNMGWLYWCIMGLTGIFLGVFGSVFNTYASLYQAGDNDLLLSMPIPASRILVARLMGVYAMGLMYELIVMVPAVLVWFLTVPQGLASILGAVLCPLLLSLLVLVLSAVLGWVVALVAARLKNKNIITVVISLVFIVAYYYCYSKAFSLIQSILTSPDLFGGKIKRYLYPLYRMGLGAEGDMLSLVLFALMVGAVAAICYGILVRSFLKLATANRGSSRKAYREKSVRLRSTRRALLGKELSRFFGSANYMLNCGLGSVFMPVAAVLLLWKQETIRELMTLVPGELCPLLGAAAVCTIVTMNDMAAASVSLEGKNLWILQSLPVAAEDVLMAKLNMHLVLSLVPAIPLILAVEWVLKPGLLFGILIPVAAILFVLLMGEIGLAVNLKLPNLNWTSEIIPIKQSAAVSITLFGGWGLVLVLGGLYYLAGAWLGAVGFFLVACGLLVIGSGLLLQWLLSRGSRILQTL